MSLEAATPGHRKILVSGVSGVGKSYLAAKLNERGNVNAIDMDDFGQLIDEKFIIDFDKLNAAVRKYNHETVVLIGTSDNVEELAYSVGGLDSIFILKPDLETARTINRLRAEGARDKNRKSPGLIPESRIVKWERASKIRPRDYNELVDRYASIFDVVGTIPLIYNYVPTKAPQRGWHIN